MVRGSHVRGVLYDDLQDYWKGISVEILGSSTNGIHD